MAGWVGFVIYLVIVLEAHEITFFEHFLSPEREGIRFRALVLFAPFILTVLGFMVNEREKLVRKVFKSQDSLRQMNRELMDNNELLKREIMERERAEERVRRYKLTHDVLEHAPFGLNVVNSEGGIDYVNPAMLEISGWSREDFLGTNVFQRPIFVETGVSEKIALVFKGRPFRIGLVTNESHSIGKPIVWNFTGVPFEEEGAMKALIFVEDMTERKKAEDAMRDMIKEKDMFITRLGHDLKTPLTPLITLLPIVRQETENPRLRKLLEINIQNVDAIKDIVIKTIKQARITSGFIKQDIMDIGLEQAVQSYIGKRDYLIRESGITIHNQISPETVVAADRSELEELFYNIISNAIKYTPEKGSVTISAEPDGDFVTVSVSDTGVGLTQEQIKHIFQGFYKIGDNQRELDSSGLGLFICRKIVEKNGGRIWAESPGKGLGTTIHFTLRVAGEA